VSVKNLENMVRELAMKALIYNLLIGM